MAPGAVPPPPAVDDARPAVAPLPCPRCAQPLEPRSARCGACDLPLTGLVAASLWRVDQRIAALHRQRAELLAQLVDSDGASVAPGAVSSEAPGAARTRGQAPAGPTGVDGPGGVSPRSVDRVPGGPVGAQRVLLVAGVVLVTASALGLGALAVTRLGALGQLAVLALLVAGALAASRWSVVRRLTASGESFAVLAVALATTGAGAVRGQGVIGSETVPDRAWPLVVVASLCVLSAVAAATLRRGGRPMAFGWAALSTGALVPSTLAVLLEADGPGLAAVLLGAAALLPLAASALRSHGPAARSAVLVVAALHLGAGGLLSAGLLVDAPTSARALALGGVLVALTAAALAWDRAARLGDAPSVLAGPAGTARSLSPVAVVVAWAAGGGAVLAAASAGGGVALVVVAVVLAIGACAALITRAPRVPWAAVVTTQAVAAACLLLGAAQNAWDLSATVPPTAPTGTWAAWLAVAAAAATTAVLRPAPAARSSGGPDGPGGTLAGEAMLVWVAVAAAAAVAAALSVPPTWPATVVGGQEPSVPALAVVATLALTLAAHLSQIRARRGVVVVLVVAWVVALALALAPAAGFVAGGTEPVGDGLPVPARAVLALAGAQALVLGALPRWAPARAAGVALLALAWWATVGDLAPGAAVEVWSLPPALLALAVGVLTWRSHPSLSSWVALGPALLLGLAPSTVAALTLDAPDGTDVLGSGARPAVVVAVALVLVLAGVRRSWQAPLVLGAAVAILVGLAQLGPYLAAVPLWVTTGAAGVVVLALAVRLEVARRSSARALSWLAALR